MSGTSLPFSGGHVRTLVVGSDPRRACRVTPAPDEPFVENQSRENQGTGNQRYGPARPPYHKFHRRTVSQRNPVVLMIMTRLEWRR